MRSRCLTWPEPPLPGPHTSEPQTLPRGPGALLWAIWCEFYEVVMAKTCKPKLVGKGGYKK